MDTDIKNGETQLSYYVSLLDDSQRQEVVAWVDFLDKITAPTTLQKFGRFLMRPFNNAGAPDENVRLAALTRIFSSLKRAQDISLEDALTGIPNRRYFDGAIARVVSRMARQDRESSEIFPAHALLIFDMNGLKPINDTYGHQAGDAAIKTFAQKLKSVVRSDEDVARYGGDEFCVILTDTSRTGNFIEGSLAHFRKELEGLTFDYDGKSYPLGAKFGIVRIRTGMTAEEAIHQADSKLLEMGRTSRAQREGIAPAALHPQVA